MCQFCSASAVPPGETRRQFLQKFAATVVTASLVRAPRLLAQSAGSGTQAGWGRLVTSSRFWNLHMEQDAAIASLIHKNLEGGMQAKAFTVNPAELRELSSFPFLYTNDLTAVTDPRAAANLKESLRRGSFYLVDACVDHRVTRGFGPFLAKHTALFAQLLPGSTVRPLPAAHAIYQALAPVKEEDLAIPDAKDDAERWQGAPEALYGVFDGDRIASVISIHHLQCEWLTRSQRIRSCVAELANIYVYAMTR